MATNPEIIRYYEEQLKFLKEKYDATARLLNELEKTHEAGKAMPVRNEFKKQFSAGMENMKAKTKQEMAGIVSHARALKNKIDSYRNGSWK